MIRTRLRTAVTAAAVAVLLALLPAGAAQANPERATPRPTIVLVHGAWADGSSWGEVVPRLQRAGYPVLVVATPLRSLAGDAAQLSAVLRDATTGPVVLVGHSYGGAVITNAGTSDPDVRALVYLDAYAPAFDETVFGLTSALPGSLLGGDPRTTFDVVQGASGAPDTLDLTVTPAIFREAFTHDLPDRTGEQLAVSQRPLTLAAGSGHSGQPAWATLPSWYLVGTQDRVIPPAQQRAMAQRAGSTVTEVRSGHLSMLTSPDRVARVIEDAARSTR